MPIKDIFQYTARWESVGLDCSYCIYERNAVWPNLDRNYACGFHNRNMSIQLNQNGYKEGEWFCKCFEKQEVKWSSRWFKQVRSVHPDAIMVFQKIKNTLNEKVFYKCAREECLKEVLFEELPKYKN